MQKIILFDSNQYWTHLLAQFECMVEAGALSAKHREQLIVVQSISDLFAKLDSHELDSNGFADRF